VIIRVQTGPNLREALQPAVDALLAGELVAVPTETVYGLACDALNEAAVARLRAAKGRGDDHPLPVQVAQVSDLRTVAGVLPSAARQLAERFWPGPLTLVCPRAEAVPALVSSGRNTVGVRIPDHPIAHALLKAVGRPLAVPSANRTGEPPLPSARAVADVFGERVAVIIDWGAPFAADAMPSTVVDATVHPPKVLREGALSTKEILTVCALNETA